MPGLASIGRQVMAGGLSAGQVQALSGTITTGISAAGTTRGTATALTAAMNLISTAASLSGVALPTVNNGDAILVFNDATGNSFYVYPENGTSTINQIAAGSGILLANNTSCIFQKVTATRWVANLSA